MGQKNPAHGLGAELPPGGGVKKGCDEQADTGYKVPEPLQGLLQLTISAEEAGALGCAGRGGGQGAGSPLAPGWEHRGGTCHVSAHLVSCVSPMGTQPARGLWQQRHLPGEFLGKFHG